MIVGSIPADDSCHCILLDVVVVEQAALLLVWDRDTAVYDLFLQRHTAKTFVVHLG